VGILLPSSLITYAANRLSVAHEDLPLMRAFRKGLSPVAIGLTASAGWVIAASADGGWVGMGADRDELRRGRCAPGSIPLWLIGAGALAGAPGRSSEPAAPC
jgi:chromate transporter